MRPLSTLTMSLKHLVCLSSILQIVGLLLFCLTVYWVEHHKNGLAWGATDLGIDFNWHPVLMTLSLILLYGNGQYIRIKIASTSQMTFVQAP